MELISRPSFVAFLALNFIISIGAQKKKDVRDYTDADMERLLQEWDKDEEPVPDDELPPPLRRNQPMVDLNNLDMNDPDSVMKMTKKGKTTMMFVSVSGTSSKRDTEQVSELWEQSLHNAHMDLQRYIVDDDRVLFVFPDGSDAWTAKEFLLKQQKVKKVTLEGKDYEPKKKSEL